MDGLTGLDVKIERIRAGVRQYHVAGALRISQTTLSQIENGQKPVTQDRLGEIARTIRDLAPRERQEGTNGR